MRSILAESLVIIGACLVAGAGFLVSLPVGCCVAGVVCLLIGVGLIRSQKRTNE